MSSVRVLVGTRKGAFVLTADGKREKWDVSAPISELGTLSRQGIAGRPESAIRVAIERLARTGDSALQ